MTNFTQPSSDASRILRNLRSCNQLLGTPVGDKSLRRIVLNANSKAQGVSRELVCETEKRFTRALLRRGAQFTNIKLG